MTTGDRPDSGLSCPRCMGSLDTWARGRLQVEFCGGCSALFLDRGELFELFRSEGYHCPPEAHLRFGFSARDGGVLNCPKCKKTTLAPGTVEGAEVWHCTPCNGFLVDRGLLLGEAAAHDVPLHLQGFELLGGQAGRDGTEALGHYVGRLLGRMSSWSTGS